MRKSLLALAALPLLIGNASGSLAVTVRWCNFTSGNSFGVWSLSPCRGMPRQGLSNLVFHGIEATMEKQEWTD